MAKYWRGLARGFGARRRSPCAGTRDPSDAEMFSISSSVVQARKSPARNSRLSATGPSAVATTSISPPAASDKRSEPIRRNAAVRHRRHGGETLRLKEVRQNPHAEGGVACGQFEERQVGPIRRIVRPPLRLDRAVGDFRMDARHRCRGRSRPPREVRSRVRTGDPPAPLPAAFCCAVFHVEQQSRRTVEPRDKTLHPIHCIIGRKTQQVFVAACITLV